MSRTNLVTAAALAALGLTCSAARAQTTYTVSPVDNIQAVISTAAHGDTIELIPGEYQQVFAIVDKALTVRSLDPLDPDVVAATIVNGVGINSVISIFNPGASGTRIEGLTIFGGQADDGGGVRAESAGQVSILACVLIFNDAGRGGDLDGDGAVGVTDLVELILAWGVCP